MKNFFAKIGKEIDLWTHDDWGDFNQWKLDRLQEMYDELNCVENKTDLAIQELQQLKNLIEIVKKQMQPENSSSISPGE